MNIVFRVDASLDIGSGHVMRCLTLAKTLGELGANVSFICREHPGNLLELIRDRGFNSAALLLPDTESCESFSEGGYTLSHDSWLGTDWRSDAEQSQVAITDEKVDWLIVDHYALDARWESAMRPFCERLMVIDDLADRDHDCDLLLDQNLVAGRSHRYNDKIPEYCHRLLGPKFALLQPEYAKLHPEVRLREGSIGRVLVYFGGADLDNLTGRAIKAFKKLNRRRIWVDVVVNSNHPYMQSIYSEVEGSDHIELHVGMSTLAPLMTHADLSVGAAGTTSWERCCLGLPAIVITIAENQKLIAEELHRKGLIRWVGHKDEVNAAKLLNDLTKLLDSALPSDWSKRCWEAVDGQGVERITRILTLGPKSRLRARLAEVADEHLVLKWANDSLVRQNSFDPTEIADDTHAEWFYGRLKDFENCRIYVIEDDACLPIGQVRFDRHDPDWEITYALDPLFRGRGLAKKFLATAVSKMRRDKNVVVLFGRVKETNKASCRVFEALGFQKTITGHGVAKYFCQP